MIKKIKINGVATFRNPALLVTEKRINLIYGLNGSGKTTISRFLRDRSNPAYVGCSIEPATESPMLVYNADFVRDNFYESDALKGIFSLSKENKEAADRIASASALKRSAEQSRGDALGLQESHQRSRASIVEVAQAAAWEIKTKYSGGDRVLEFCLDGVKGKKDALFEKLKSTPLPAERPNYSVEDLKKQAATLMSSDGKLVSKLGSRDLKLDSVEEDPIFAQPISGNKESAVAALMSSLGNADWVREGLKYVRRSHSLPTECPFCQSQTITGQLLAHIDSFFDESYTLAVTKLENLAADYSRLALLLPSTDELDANLFTTAELRLAVATLRSEIESNELAIAAKISSPSESCALRPTKALVENVNHLIGEVDRDVSAHNDRITNKQKSLDQLKSKFWDLMRFDYDQTISRYFKDVGEIDSKVTSAQVEVASHDAAIAAHSKAIEIAQRETLNVDDAIVNINASLSQFGISDFHIEKHGDQLYRLRRNGSAAGDNFATLSEGEKMIITLLYFCELCKGRSGAEDTGEEKIVVLDDPISSLSHLYVFNVGQIIRSTFFRGSVGKQIFVLTHSLYFFYELTDPNHDRRGEMQSLHRITKGASGSSISVMKYEEIQNDYQAYWTVVNDRDQHPALIANCMRNIIEYFFNFVSKKDFNNVFLDARLLENRFQAFARYMNRESHSLGQNIFDLKDFDYDVFRDGLRIVFEAMSYDEHYSKMSKLGIAAT